jgi:Fic family protein
MQSFRDLDRLFARLPLDVVTQLSAIAEGRGREAAARLRRTRELALLQELAIVRSIDTSNAIEGITAPATRIAALAKLAAPRNRSEQEIAGYRYALGQIHEHAPDIPFEPRYVLQLHGYLYRYTGVRHAGEFKRLDNWVEERRPDGTIVQRFLPLDAARTPAAMQELHDGFAVADDRGAIPYPLLCAAYVLDFLTIHPFTDGNGRMSRLVTSWLLYRGGFEVARFISLDQIVSDTSAGYYEALAASTAGWHENRHDAMPWTRYFLGLLVSAYHELDERMSALGSSGASKHDRIVDFIARMPRADFSVTDVRAAVPDVSRDYLGVVLRGLRDEGSIERTGAGRGSRWRRVSSAVRWRER